MDAGLQLVVVAIAVALALAGVYGLVAWANRNNRSW
jgi:hypothetical protein